MTPNRLVATLTPLIFAPLAGAISAFVAKEFPGVEVPASALEEIFIAGALIALAPAAQWLNGWQKHEQRESERATRVLDLDAREAALAAREQEFNAGGRFVEDDALLPPDDDLDAGLVVELPETETAER